MKTKYAAAVFFLCFLALVILWTLDGSGTVDFHYRDTYFVIASAHICFIFGGLTLFFVAAYLLGNSLLPVRWMISVHCIAMILSVVIIFKLVTSDADLRPQRYLDYSDLNSVQSFRSHSEAIIKSALIGAIVFGAGQISFCSNLIAGTVKKLRNRRSE